MEDIDIDVDIAMVEISDCSRDAGHLFMRVMHQSQVASYMPFLTTDLFLIFDTILRVLL